MDANIYSVESSIQQFFDTLTTATRAECDVMAASLVGEPVKTAPIQGMSSYTSWSHFWAQPGKYRAVPGSALRSRHGKHEYRHTGSLEACPEM